MIDDSMSVADANRLVDARLKKIKAVQAIVAPQSKGTGSPAAIEQGNLPRGFNAEQDAEWSRVLREGPPEVQQAVQTLLKALGDLRAKSEGRHEDVVVLKDNVPDET